MKTAGNNRHGHRDATMILMAFRHGLRASELCSLRLEQVDLAHGLLHMVDDSVGAMRCYRCAAKIDFGIMPWIPLVPSTTWVT